MIEDNRSFDLIRELIAKEVDKEREREIERTGLGMGQDKGVRRGEGWEKEGRGEGNS